MPDKKETTNLVLSDAEMKVFIAKAIAKITMMMLAIGSRDEEFDTRFFNASKVNSQYFGRIDN